MALKKQVSLNLNVRGLAPSATLTINETVKEIRRNGGRIFNFGLGQSPFPVPQSVVNALKHHAHEKDYLPVVLVQFSLSHFFFSSPLCIWYL